jgi:beta-lactamase superfamily II metal-dependent hydrolase
MLAMLLLLATAPAGLEVHYIDTEGGAATLLVTPAGESVLIDAGNPGKRDAERIHAACNKLGLEAIDHLIITHWHLDHYGSVGPLSKLIPIRHFYDRGIPEKLDEDKGNFPLLIRAYKEASGGKSITVKPGDLIPIKQTEGKPKLEIRVVCASGKVLPPLAGAPENPIAKEHKPKPEDKSDNAKSVGVVVSYGAWRFLNLGDLTWNVEYELVAPSDRLGLIDVYQVTHHGLEISNNPVLVRTVAPRVAIFNNGPRKGAHPTVLRTLQKVPGIEGIFQMHRNLNPTGDNTDEDKIANDGRKKESGTGIVVKVAPDGKSYTVTVQRTGKTFEYKTRATLTPGE